MLDLRFDFDFCIDSEERGPFRDRTVGFSVGDTHFSMFRDVVSRMESWWFEEVRGSFSSATIQRLKGGDTENRSEVVGQVGSNHRNVPSGGLVIRFRITARTNREREIVLFGVMSTELTS